MLPLFKQKVGSANNVEFSASIEHLKQFMNHYSLHNVEVSAEVIAAEEFVEMLDKLMWMKITCQSKSSIQMKPPCSANRCLKVLSFIKSQANARFQDF